MGNFLHRQVGFSYLTVRGLRRERERIIQPQLGVDDFGIDSGTEVVIAAQHSADRLRHLGDGGLLEKVTDASGLQYLVDINFPAVRRKDDNGVLRQGTMKEGGRLAGKLQIRLIADDELKPLTDDHRRS